MRDVTASGTVSVHQYTAINNNMYRQLHAWKKQKIFSILNLINIASNTRGCKMERINNFPKLYLQSHYYRQVLRIVKNRICMANIPSVSNNQQL